MSVVDISLNAALDHKEGEQATMFPSKLSDLTYH